MNLKSQTFDFSHVPKPAAITKNAVTLTIDELDRLRNLAFAEDPRKREAEERRQTKLELQTMSKNRMATWTNTIQGYVA